MVRGGYLMRNCSSTFFSQDVESRRDPGQECYRSLYFLPINSRMQVLGQTGAGEGMQRYRRVVFAGCAIALLALLAHVGVAFWAQSEFTQPEGIVATQALSLAQEGVLYYDLKQYPYTVCAYMPLLYGLVAGMHKLGLPLLLSGRLISILALGGIFYLVWKILLLHTGERLCAWTGVALAGMTQVLLSWGVVGRADMPAVALSLAAFYQYSRYLMLGEETLDRAAGLAIAGLFTKQTVIAAPAAIFVLLLLESPMRALRFGGIVGGIGGAMVLGLNALLDGRFLENTLFSNMNPFAWFKLEPHFEYIGLTLGPLLIVLAVGAKKAIETRMRAVFVYLGIALTVLLATAGKLGSDFNYEIETAVLVVICSCLALHALNFFWLFSIASRSWITLLTLPLALYGAQNLKVAAFELADRIDREQLFRVQLVELGPFLSGKGRVLSADSNALVHSQRRIEVEPLIYRLLVEAGRVDGSRVLRDIEQSGFQTILLFENTADQANTDPEFPRLMTEQMDAIRNRYRLVKHLPGPYVSGLYVYQPSVERAQ